MNLIKVASGVVNQTPLDWNNNLNNLKEVIKEAKEQDVSILCLPELAISGYGAEDAFYSPNTYEQSLSVLSELVGESSGIAFCVGLPVWYNNKIYNSSCFIADGRILGFVCKQHLPNYGIFYEDRWFNRWPAGVQSEITIDKITYPIGDLTFSVGGVKIGLEICEDAWVANRPGNSHFDNGVHVILNPSASPFSFNKFVARERLVMDASRTYGCTYVYTNLLGNESGRLIFDGDAMVASNGSLLASSPRFSYSNYTLTCATVDLDENAIEQSQIKTTAKSNKNTIYWPFSFPACTPTNEKATLEPFEKSGYIKEEEFARAVGLALFDYLRKSRSQGYTVSLSGGADSSACVALCALMVYLADESIGLTAFKNKLGHIKKIKDLKDQKSIIKELVHTLYQGSNNSSDATYNSAKNLADSIGATFMNISIADLVESYTTKIESQLGRKLSWDTDDIALQNIQARVRAPSIWMFTNISNHLLLSTSNRSEVAVGYATMDGDTAGSLSPIADIDKHWLRSWLVWLEKTGCQVKGKQIKVEGLKYVNKLAPTAELRPSDKNQTDEADLMPYNFLNELENLAIAKRKSPIDCLDYLNLEFKEQYSQQQMVNWIKRFFRLWSRNQWKRERYAISFHLDNYNLDPRSWCRFPILSGGFTKELEELDASLLANKKVTKGTIGF